ncbi:MAG: SoxR reducing system RseC family protein [Aquimonas sp.]|nr:SoxR reducing system RseC family protein [Aquimonas sp.]
MASRRAEVLSVRADAVELRCTQRCSDCQGCGGRCQIFLTGSDDRLRLPSARLPHGLTPGLEVELLLPDDVLRAQALRGYGMPLLGLVGGAAALQPWGNTAAALGASLGVLLAVWMAGRLPAIQPQLRMFTAATLAASDTPETPR